MHLAASPPFAPLVVPIIADLADSEVVLVKVLSNPELVVDVEEIHQINVSLEAAEAEKSETE